MTNNSFWKAPDNSLIAAAASAEMLLAKFRIVAISCIIVVPTYKIITGSDFSWATWIGHIALALSIGVYIVLKRHRYSSVLGFSTLFIDISFITLGLLTEAMSRDSILAAVNNRGSFELYYLAILSASLRYDKRMCVFAGLLTLCCYGSMVVIAEMTPTEVLANDPWTERYGHYFFPDQISRFIALTMATGLSFLIVARSNMLLQLAIHDPLTGLYNRNFLREGIRIRMERSKREQKPMAIAILDLDYFKQINDKYGHQCGDNILKSFATFLLSHLREDDIVARYGGEEFCVICSNIDAVGLQQLLAKFQRELARESFPTSASGPQIQFTFSAGVTQFCETLSTGDRLIGEADRLLLKAKSEGRDRVLVS
ncbi:GGDEF domain-containing protein [Pleionea sp. CnH1-48]|uniref:GGDEF domain-containing protein n=1 Tax=Pleionea sp. CnH1-48 TaxID=2954494 RepID=UPI0020972F81|nr:GGDEF domain-containing protein [Pleionea sp. CnH1-48]MCO7222909.1 GGDEF domain-containing protein [Pleionea sp. CnH1-48]